MHGLGFLETSFGSNPKVDIMSLDLLVSIFIIIIINEKIILSSFISTTQSALMQLGFTPIQGVLLITQVIVMVAPVDNVLKI
jgi:hypothetical protein